MKRKIGLSLLVLVLATMAAVPVFAKGGRAGSEGVIYVRSQGLYFDTFVSASELPMKGRFQKLYTFENAISETEYGPGDVGYLGGRWWIDTDGDNIMEETDTFLLCPLLGPGRENP